MSDERWRIAQGHMSGHFARSEDPADSLRKAAGEAAGYPMGVDLFDARRHIDTHGGPNAILRAAAERADAQMRQSAADCGTLTQQAAILKDKLRGGGK